METNNQALATTIKIELPSAYEPEALSATLVNVRNLNDALALSDQVPSLIRLRLHYGKEGVEDIIRSFLFELCDMVNLKRPLNDKQVDRIAQEVVQSYSVLTIADVFVIFRMAINGEFGDLYESLDVPKVLKWFAVYFDERCNTAAEQSISNQMHDKGSNLTPERMRSIFDKMEKKFKK